ncbi:hypothetical protein JW823_05975 [bacterium]|nr:hypothetical protein [candidate division CSSED10-310 bacterium]
MNRRHVIFSLIFIVAIVWVSMGCSDSPRTAEVKSKQPADQSAPNVSQDAPQSQTKEVSHSIKGGREMVIDPFTFVLPGDWKEAKGSQVWCPPTEDATKPLPAVHLHHGGRPSTLIKGSGLMDGIKSHIGVDPQDVKLMKMGGMDAATCSWEKGGNRSVGLFMLEEIKLVDMEVLHFFTCLAPKDSFPQYEDTFTAILASVRL